MIKIIYYVCLVITILAVLNFVWMAAGPGPKQNFFKLIQDKLHLSKCVMNGIYLSIGFAALLTGVISICYVKKAEECLSVSGDD